MAPVAATIRPALNLPEPLAGAVCERRVVGQPFGGEAIAVVVDARMRGAQLERDVWKIG